MTLKLLVFGINYFPEPISTGLNTTGLSRGLAALGWPVTVVTGYPHYPAWRAEPAPADSVIDGVRVLRSHHYVPAHQSLLKRGVFELSWFASGLSRLTARRPVDIVLGVVPNLSAAPLAALAAARYHVPLALLFQDLVGRAAEQSGIENAGKAAGAIRSLETQIARKAEGVGIVAEGFRDYFLSAGVSPARITRIRNPHRLSAATESRQAARARLGWMNDDFIVLHTGNMGFKQGLDSVVRAAAALPAESPVRFVLQGDGSQKQVLESQARDLGVRALSFLPLASDADFPNIVRASDALLLNQKASVCNMSMPGKLGTYFAAGLPVIAAVSPQDETAYEICASGGGLLATPDNPADLLRRIDELRVDPALARRLGAAGQAHAERHLTEESFVGAVKTFLESVAA